MPHAGGGPTAYPLGCQLQEIRKRQESARITERYDKGHLERLDLYKRKKPHNFIRKEYCSAVHGRGCTVCATCHFCRQKTIDRKTTCASCGNGAGIWCGNCLDNRMGENIAEVLPRCETGEWKCPVCRDLCNCSGASCLRTSKGWEATTQLVHEARHLGYASVAHYLVLTALDWNAVPSALVEPAQGFYRRKVDHGPDPRAAAAAAWRSRQGSRLARARQECTRMLQASTDEALEQWKGGSLRQQVARECGMGLDVLNAEDEEDEEEQLRSHRQQAARAAAAGVLSPNPSVPGPARVPVPLFAGAGGSAAGAGAGGGGTLQQQQQQQQPRAGSGPRQAADGASGRAAGAAAGLADMGVLSPGAAAAASEPGGPLDLLGLNLPAEELGVLGIRGCTPAYQPPAAWTSPTGHTPSLQQDGSSWGNAGAAGTADAAGGGGSGQQRGGSMPQQRQHSRPASATPGGMGREQQQQRQQQPAGPQQQQRQQQQPAAPQQGCTVADFGADDLPGSEAPGYRDAAGAAEPWGSRQRGMRRRFGSLSAHVGRERAAGRRPRARLQQAWGPQMVSGGPVRLLPAAAAGEAGRASPDGAEQQPAVGRRPTPGLPSPPPAGSAAAAASAGTPAAVAVATAAAAGGGGDGGGGLEDEFVEILGASTTADAAAAAPAGKAEAAGPGAAGSEPSLKRARPAAPAGAHNSSSTLRPAAAGSGQVDSTVFTASEANSSLDQAERMQQELVLLLSGPWGISYDELCERLRDMMDVVFEDWVEQPAGTLMQEGTAPASSTCSLDTLQRACRLLVFLGYYAPLEPDKDPTCDDIVRRLSNLDFFVDFSSSGLDARKELIKAAKQLADVFNNRWQAESAVEMAACARGPADPAPGSYASTVELAEAGLTATKIARQGLSDTVECLLNWMTVLHQEAKQARELHSTPTDLLVRRKLGPINWGSCSELRQREWAGLDKQQVQEEEEELREVRKLQLETLGESNGAQLASIARFFSTLEPMSRALATQVLESSVVPQLLELDVRYNAQVREAVLTMVFRLLRLAAPDLQAQSAWQADVPDMRRVLRGLAQQPLELQQRLGRPPADSGQLQVQAERLMCQLLDEQLDPAARQQVLSELHSSVGQVLLGPVEDLVAAEYQLRLPGPFNKVKPEGRDVSCWRQHSVAVGAVKVDVLAALYALQLQAGASWQQVQALVAQPDADLGQFFRVRAANYRLVVLYLVSQVVSAAPSLLRWDSTGSAGALPPNSIPAQELMRLWLRAMLDQHAPKAFGKCMEHVMGVLARAPATAPLFAGLRARLEEQGRVQATLAQDCGIQASGSNRATVLKAVLGQLRHSWDGRSLSSVLHNLHTDLRAWQPAKDSPSKVLRWQRTCLLSLLSLTQLHLQFPSSESAVGVAELLNIATAWMQDSIKAVCGQRQQPRDNSSSGLADVYVEESALQHLTAYLGMVVRLAGHARQLERQPTSAWPAAAVSSASDACQLLSSAVEQASPRAGGSILGLGDKLRELFCLRDLLGCALWHMSAQDQPGEQDSALLGQLASALAQQSGLLPGIHSQGGIGHSSPGLLHHVLSVHVHAVLKDAAKGTPAAVHRGINALHLVSRLCGLLLTPAGGGPQAVCSQRLLLPCLAYPLLELTMADVSVAGCCRLQLHVFRLLQQLLGGPLGQQLLPPPGQDLEGQPGAASFSAGPLCKLQPLQQHQVQRIFLELMKLNLHRCVLIATAQSGAGAASAASAPGSAQQRLTCGPNITQLLLQLLGCARHVDEPTRMYPGSGTVADSPADAAWKALEAGIRFAAQLAQQPGVAQQAVLDTLFPDLFRRMAQQPVPPHYIRAAYAALVQQLPADDQELWRVSEHTIMPPPAAVRQQQPQQQEPQLHRQLRHAGRNQQQQPQQQQAPLRAGGAVSKPAPSECGSQACSMVGGPVQQAVAGGAVPAASLCEPAASHMPFSQAGGRVASCGGPAGGLHGGTAAAAARAQQRKRPGAAGEAGQEAGEDGEVSSSSNSLLHKKQRVHTLQQQQGLQQQGQEVPDVCSQDQGASQGDVTQPPPHPQQQQCLQDESTQLQPGRQLRQQQHAHDADATQLQPVQQQQQQRRQSNSSSQQGGLCPFPAFWVAVKSQGPQAGTSAGQKVWQLFLSGTPCSDRKLRLERCCYIVLNKALQDTATELRQRKLLSSGTRVLVTQVRKEHKALEIEVCGDSELLVDPDAAAAAGLQYGQEQRKEWASSWAWKEQQLRAARGATSSRAKSSSEVNSDGCLLGVAAPTQQPAAADAGQPQQQQQQPERSVVDSQATIKYPTPPLPVCRGEAPQ